MNNIPPINKNNSYTKYFTGNFEDDCFKYYTQHFLLQTDEYWLLEGFIIHEDLWYKIPSDVKEILMPERILLRKLIECANPDNEYDDSVDTDGIIAEMIIKYREVLSNLVDSSMVFYEEFKSEQDIHQFLLDFPAWPDHTRSRPWNALRRLTLYTKDFAII